MNKKLQFDKYYFFAALLLFLVELVIALYVKDNFVRPYLGDLLVVILIYCCLKSFWKADPFNARHWCFIVRIYSRSGTIF